MRWLDDVSVIQPIPVWWLTFRRGPSAVRIMSATVTVKPPASVNRDNAGSSRGRVAFSPFATCDEQPFVVPPTTLIQAKRCPVRIRNACNDDADLMLRQTQQALDLFFRLLCDDRSKLVLDIQGRRLASRCNNRQGRIGGGGCSTGIQHRQPNQSCCRNRFRVRACHVFTSPLARRLKRW